MTTIEVPVTTDRVNTKRLAFHLEKAGFSLPSTVLKRDGTLAVFEIGRIVNAVQKCFDALDTPVQATAVQVAENAARAISARTSGIPTVEEIQDAVEFSLFSLGEFAAAKAYTLYREGRTRERKVRDVPTHVVEAFAIGKTYVPTEAQEFSFMDKYARFDWDKGRRETWPETVDRVVDHLRWEVDQHLFGGLPDSTYAEIHHGILHMEVMPSMRLLAMAGEAARRNSLSIFNCSYLPAADIQSFVEALMISMAGCGVGFSVERKYVEKFPRIARQLDGSTASNHVIEDTTEGWGEALRVGIETWMSGGDVTFDSTFVRPAGTPLRTKGGRASGPGPFLQSLATIRDIILSRQGSYLRTTDVHLIMCAVGNCAVQGGVRRTAMICLFDWDDHEMRNIKSGPNMNPLLWNSNNSAVWPEDITDVQIMRQMLEMVESHSGEPGIFSRANAIASIPDRREPAEFGTNPCGEIFLRPYGLCNLSQAVCRPGDTEETLSNKVRLATIIGVIQSLSTRFPGMRQEWVDNAIEERLLGVDLTAQSDCALTQDGAPGGDGLRSRLRDLAVTTADEYAARLNINIPAAVTCNKPAGNSTELLGASGNGIHRPHSPYFIRRMTVGAHTPVFKVLRDAGVPMEPQVGSSADTATKWIAEFPKRTPSGSPTKKDSTALSQLEFWLLNKEHWTEHNPSCTITYRDDEVVDMIAWVVKHKDRIGGLSFLPTDGAVYAQMPFEEITEDEFIERLESFPTVDYSQIYAYEIEDMTTAAQELACFSGAGCEV